VVPTLGVALAAAAVAIAPLSLLGKWALQRFKHTTAEQLGNAQWTLATWVYQEWTRELVMRGIDPRLPLRLRWRRRGDDHGIGGLQEFVSDASGIAEMAEQFLASEGRRALEEPVRDREVLADIAHALSRRLKVAGAFADFGFPESHSASFAHIVSASAWMKVHYPAAFYADVADCPNFAAVAGGLAAVLRARRVIIYNAAPATSWTRRRSRPGRGSRTSNSMTTRSPTRSGGSTSRSTTTGAGGSSTMSG
jgi:hypothetical protein